MRILLLCIGLCCVHTWAQKDFGLWTGLELRVPLTQKLDVGLELQMRFHQNATKVNNSFLSPYLKYELHRHLGVGLSYRYSNEPDGQGVFGSTNLHRLTVDLEAKKLLDLVTKDSPFDAALRLRYTHETTMGDRNNDYWRTQFEIRYDWKQFHLKPEVSAEFFYHFNDQLSYSFDEVRVNHRFNKFRIRLGFAYDISKRSEAKIFYMLQSQLESPNADYILGLGYTYRFKRIFGK